MYARCNGSIGCLPDSIDAHDTREDAIESAGEMFSDLPMNIHDQMMRMLREDGIYYFDAEARDAGAGADYVEVWEMNAEEERAWNAGGDE